MHRYINDMLTQWRRCLLKNLSDKNYLSILMKRNVYVVFFKEPTTGFFLRQIYWTLEIPPLKTKQICCLETSGTNHPLPLCHIPVKRKLQTHRCKSRKPRIERIQSKFLHPLFKMLFECRRERGVNQ
jgi:hypothetical protein